MKKKKVTIRCTWCNLTDDYDKMPEKVKFKCPYCGNRIFIDETK